MSRRSGEPTKTYLARELLHAGLHELSFRAATGEFDDYADVHVCGPTALHGELVRAGRMDFARRVASGEFDATLEESEEWARSQTDPEVVRMMGLMGIGPDRTTDH